MADNYLEKKMEEHRLAAASRPTRRVVSSAAPKPGFLELKFKPLRVLVTDATTPAAEAVVRRLTGVGCRVAFTSTDLRQGRELSQATGSRFYPVKAAGLHVGPVVDNLCEVWGGVDAMVLTGVHASEQSGIAVPESCTRVIALGLDAQLPECVARDGLTVNAVRPENISAADAAEFCLYLLLPASSFINKQLFTF